MNLSIYLLGWFSRVIAITHNKKSLNAYGNIFINGSGISLISNNVFSFKEIFEVTKWATLLSFQ